MKITRQEVEHVARLARLELAEEEAEKMTAQLDTILEYVAKLDELDTKGVPPTTHPHGVVNVFREDKVRDSLPREQSLANGPEHNNEAFTVPRVIS